ncbi:MAG TPA: alpha/beta hydrolase [Candidatus Hydrogenedentes bacterium]|nr:alpha/beta hydrolase [Candidatus Hydrogenedentota bacterium]HPG65465.1 alpha/beta hydrolase [Candidatus Hydrogenedentota bacterium]
MNKVMVVMASLALPLAMVAGLGIALVDYGLNQRVEGEYLDVDGVRIHYTDEGEGEPVVLIHGLAVNADLNWRWPGLTEALARDYRVIALDNRGHGLSDAPDDAAQYGEEQVKDVIRILDRLGIEKAHIVGYSMGGFMTLKLAMEYPDRVICAVPCAAGWVEENPENRALLDGLIKDMDEGHGFAAIEKHLAPPSKRSNALWLNLVNTVISHIVDTKVMAKVVRGFDDFAITEEQLRANAVPIRLIVGSEDGMRERVDALESVLANHDVIIVEGGNHMTTVIRPELLEGIRGFLAERRAGPGA